jgi:hypothetical protein
MVYRWLKTVLGITLLHVRSQARAAARADRTCLHCCTAALLGDLQLAVRGLDGVVGFGFLGRDLLCVSSVSR